MNTAKSLPLRVRLLHCLAVLFLMYAAGFALAQTASFPGQQPAPSQQQSPTAPQPPRSAEQDKSDVKITPDQAQALFHSVDEILDFDSKQTGMPIRHDVKRKLTSRDEVVKFLTKHMNDEDTQRLRRSELVLKKFGLLPRDFDLETFFVSLLREEVAGYYDPKTKTVNLLDWVPMEEQEPVMAHELTHALQDQSVGLEKWMKKGDKDLDKIKRPLTPQDIENDELDDAREAVVEGQAQAMTFQYAIAPTGRSITDSPDMVDAMEDETLNGDSSTKIFNSAPIFIKESLTFPYSYGMDFVIKVLQKAGKERAFEGVLHDPPHTTRQIMQPETYLSGEKIEPLRVPDFKRDFKDYEKFDIGAMGEFDVAVLMEQYAGKPISKYMYPEWRGGYYYAARPKAGKGFVPAINAPLALLYVSRWSGPQTAQEFAGIYAHSLKQRYNKVEETGSAASDNNALQPTAYTPDSQQTQSGQNADSDAKKGKPSQIASLAGRHVWNTDEGTVVIEEQGDTVLVSESLDSSTTQALEKEVFGNPPR